MSLISLPQELLIATNNKGKFSEIGFLLSQVGIRSISPDNFNIPEPEENGSTFAQNSLIKAEFYAKKSGLLALADDSGLAIEALDGAPGIHSARFALDEKGQKNFPLAFIKIADELEKKNFDLSKDKLRASFICNLALFDPKTGFNISFEGKIDGRLTFPPRGENGFGYDPIFIKDGYDLTFGEIAPQKKDEISHRAQAFKKLLEWWQINIK